METHDDVAIIGLACRFPGDASSPEKFWDLLVSKRDTHGLPPNRWNPEAFYHPGKDKLHTIANKGAHFLTEDVMAFDAAFFNISHAEATALDPQQRFALEVTFEAFENAGLPIEEVAGTKTGCFMGSSSADYRDTINRDPDSNPRYSLLGVCTEMISNRTSWFYDLKGPSMTVQTACSSSLVALHVACRSILNRDSDMAIAGGVNLMLNPDYSLYLNNLTMSSKEGHSKSFDADGDGYARGEGCGIVVLKRLRDAIRDGDPIRAVIRGSGVNADGFTQGFTMPSATAQAALIRDVYSAAGLEMSGTQYVEAHGTGTKVGDPIESRAIYETIGKCASPGSKIILGSVKPNIGHLECAAGIAALIKGVLALERGEIPANLFFNTPHPAIPFDEWNLKVPTEMTPWPKTETRRMSISSFGAGGTNAHAIVENAPHSQRRSATIANSTAVMGLLGGIGTKSKSTPYRKRLFVFSSHDHGGIARVSQSLASHLENIKHSDLHGYAASLAYTLGVKRSKLPWKTYCVAATVSELRNQLSGPPGNTAVRSNQAASVGFIFTGQGAQWARMGVELFDNSVFKDAIAECDKHLSELGCSWVASNELKQPDHLSRIDKAEYSQTLCTILQIALVDMLRSWGVTPSRVVGHSSGEIAAAYCIGALSKQHAVAMAYLRGVASASLKKLDAEYSGGMMAVGMSLKDAEDLIAQRGIPDLTVACVNSPSNITLSGSIESMKQLRAAAEENGVYTRQLTVDVAYHSDHLLAVYPHYVQSMGSVDGYPQQKLDRKQSMFSSVDGGEVDPMGLGAFYWGRNLVQPVYFSDALGEMVTKATDADPVNVLVEIGPHSALSAPIKEVLEKREAKGIEYRSALTKGQNAVDTTLSLAGWLFARGVPVNVGQVNADKSPETLIDLPTYPWNHSRRFDASSRINREFAMRAHAQKSLLGAPFTSISERERVWRCHLNLSEEGWIRDHKVVSVVLLPGAGLVVMAIEGARQIADAGKEIRAFKLRDVSIGSAVVVNEDKATEAIIHLRPHLTGTAGSSSASAWLEFTVSTSGGADMPVRENCRGLIQIEYKTANDEHMSRELAKCSTSRIMDYHQACASCSYELKSDDFYRDFERVGLAFGPTFRNITKLHLGSGQSVFELSIGDPGETFSTGQPGRHHLIHPTTLDSLFSPTFSSLYTGTKPLSKPIIPTFIEELTISNDIPYAVGSKLRGLSKAKRRGYAEISADIDVFDDSVSTTYMKLRGYRCTSDFAGESQMNSQLSDLSSRLCSQPTWEHAFEMLEPAELQQVVEGAGCHTSNRLVKICTMLLHQQPQARVLELLPDTDDLEPAIGSSIMSMLNMTESSQTRYAVAGSKSNPNNKDVLSLSLSGRTAISINLEDRFDLIIIPERCHGIPGLVGSIARLKTLLNPTGKLVGGTDLGTLNEADGMSILCSFPGASSQMTVYSMSRPRVVQPEMTIVMIIEPPSPSKQAAAFTSNLVTALHAVGVAGHLVRWGSHLRELVTREHVVSLLELEQSSMENVSADDFETIRTILVASSSTLWVTGFTHPSASLAVGLMRSVRRETPGQRLQSLQLSPQRLEEENMARITAQVVCSSAGENEFLVEEDGFIKISRFFQEMGLNNHIRSLICKETRTQPIEDVGFPIKLAIGKPGLLDTLYFEQHSGLSQPLGDDEVEINVEASGVNFRDVMISMGIISTPELGYEASGVVARIGANVTNVKTGDRVCGHVIGAHATVTRTRDFMCAVIPDGISFEEAAGMPVVFTTAYHALVNLARLRPGQSILIHAAAGGVGQSAIQLARHLGVTVYATVSSPEKRRLVITRYGVPDENIFYSRDTSFAMAVKRVTGGRGVDCVLNSLSGEQLRASFYCLAPLGIMVEIGSRDVLDNTRLDMQPFSRSTTFSCFTLLDLVNEAPEIMERTMRDVFSLARMGVLRSPYPLTTLPVSQVQEAFRMMQSGKHLGKLILSFKGNPAVPVMRGSDGLQLSSNGTYLLVGGLGGLGRSLARLLVTSGAQNLAFVSRSGASTPKSLAVIDELTKLGVKVKVYCADIADEEALRRALSSCSEDLPPIKGVFQLAMLLRDSLYETMTHAQWVESTRPKIQGTWNLHQIFDSNHELDFFINFSSISGIIGNKGQANYAAGSAFQDSIAHYRRRTGLKGISIDLGIMLDVGVIAETGSTGDLKRWEEVIGVREPIFHALVKAVISSQHDNELVAKLPTQICIGLGTAEAFDAAGVEIPDYLTEDIRFGPLCSSASCTNRNLEGQMKNPASLKARLSASTSKVQAVDLITEGLVERIANLLQTPSMEIDTTRPLYLYGVDSLVAMEMRNWIRREMDAHVAIFDILEAVPMTQLAQKIATRSKVIITN